MNSSTPQLADDWPFKVGEAPFRVKGIAYTFHMEYVETEIRDGVRAQAKHLATPALRKFFEQPFFATSWYDVYPLVQAGHACGKAIGVGFEEFVRLRVGIRSNGIWDWFGERW